jgi:peptidoglycan/xylan/chitin deacetylase (PgdA/CDA1 family)
VVASYNDGTAAIVHKPYTGGHTYALGLDLGFFFQAAFNGRLDTVARTYVNGYEPSVDVFLRFFKMLYQQNEPDSITVGTVPFNRSYTCIVTHDIDFHESLVNAIEYADYEASQDVKATYFIQTKYLKDYYDIAFFDEDGITLTQQLADMGMDIASHSVAHSPVFASLPLGIGDEGYPDYQPFVVDPNVTRDASILGELRISKFFLDYFVPQQTVLSFRSGHLQYPFQISQSLDATGFRFDSSVTANNTLTHLPFRLTVDRAYSLQSNSFEIPVSFEDEQEIYDDNGNQENMLDKLPQAFELVDNLTRYGGVFNILIHPNIIDDKLEFLRQFIPAVKDRAWFDTMSNFGNWWQARDQVNVDVIQNGKTRIAKLNAPQEITGLTLQVPPDYYLQSIEPNVAYTQQGKSVILDAIQGQFELHFSQNPTSNVSHYQWF